MQPFIVVCDVFELLIKLILYQNVDCAGPSIPFLVSAHDLSNANSWVVYLTFSGFPS